MKKNELWQAVLAELQISLSTAIYNAWFLKSKIINIALVDKERQIVEIAVINPYTKTTIEARYQGQVLEILNRLTKIKNEIKISVGQEKLLPSTDPGPLFRIDFDQEKDRLFKKALLNNRLKPDFTFTTFAVSSSNEMAYAAASAVAKNPGKTYHLLYLYGGVGVGKTHLTQAVGYEILKKNPASAVVYGTSEEFTNEIVEAIQNKNTQIFRKKYRKAKALLIDDIQFLGGKEYVQEEFFHTFNAILTEGGQIVLTSDRPPHEIQGLEDRLLSRFEGGLTIDVQEPNFELRTAILRIKANQQNQELPIDVAKLIARHITSTRKLEGFLIKLIAVAKTKKEPITPDLCTSLLKEVSNEPRHASQQIKPVEILEIVASYYNLKTALLRGEKRSKPIVVPRQIAMYLIKTELKTPLMEIGRVFGNRDHTTVMHSVEKIGSLLPLSETLRNEVEALRKKLYY